MGENEHYTFQQDFVLMPDSIDDLTYPPRIAMLLHSWGWMVDAYFSALFVQKMRIKPDHEVCGKQANFIIIDDPLCPGEHNERTA